MEFGPTEFDIQLDVIQNLELTKINTALTWY